MPYTLYALFDEREPDVIRYVGFSKSPAERYDRHLKAAKFGYEKSHRIHWIRKVTGEGARVLWRPLLVVETADAAAEAEIAFIAHYFSTGHPLVNGTEGGEGVQGYGGVLSEEAAARKRAAMQTPEYLAQSAAASLKRWSQPGASDHHRQQMQKFYETPAGQQVAAQQSTLAKSQCADPNYTGGPRTPEAREKMRTAKLGKPHAATRTPEWNAKISAAQKGIPRPQSDEMKAIRAAAMRSPETRAKMSASARARGERQRFGGYTAVELNRCMEGIL